MHINEIADLIDVGIVSYDEDTVINQYDDKFLQNIF